MDLKINSLAGSGFALVAEIELGESMVWYNNSKKSLKIKKSHLDQQ
jgi:hypothetical protein